MQADRLADAIIDAADAELRDLGIPSHYDVAQRILRRLQTSGWGGGSHYLHAAKPDPIPSAGGMTQQEIAKRLGISRTTVWRRRVRSVGVEG
jgi:transcriptional regulator of acetoin/glycerol metabolism